MWKVAQVAWILPTSVRVIRYRRSPHSSHEAKLGEDVAEQERLDVDARRLVPECAVEGDVKGAAEEVDVVVEVGGDVEQQQQQERKRRSYQKEHGNDHAEDVRQRLAPGASHPATQGGSGRR